MSGLRLRRYLPSVAWTNAVQGIFRARVPSSITRKQHVHPRVVQLFIKSMLCTNTVECQGIHATHTQSVSATLGAWTVHWCINMAGVALGKFTRS